jgi:hypothetical protein
MNVALIQDSKMVVFVADDANPNAYYEAGLADAMNKEVIVVARDVGVLRVDMAHRRVIPYNARLASPLRVRLAKEVQALRTQRQPRSSSVR